MQIRRQSSHTIRTFADYRTSSGSTLSQMLLNQSQKHNWEIPIYLWIIGTKLCGMVPSRNIESNLSSANSENLLYVLLFFSS